MFHVRLWDTKSIAAFQKRWETHRSWSSQGGQQGSSTRGSTVVEATVGPEVSLTKLQKQEEEAGE